MSLTRNLTKLIRSKPVSDKDLEWAALFVLDTLGCALGALKTEPARMLQAVAPPETSDVPRRAFYLGGLAHILEMDDLHRDSVTHPGSVVIPAAWTISEHRNLNGREFLKSVLAGYEAMCRVGNSVGKAHYRVWHNTSTCGPFGSAFAAADLLKLDEDQTVWALGNAGTQSSGLWQFLATGAMSKHLHTARGAESGILAAQLAAEGFTGPEEILEGEKGFYAGLCTDPVPENVLANPDADWQLIRTSIKPWPCCRHTHPAIDAAIDLHRQLGNREIASVSVGAYQAALDVCDRPVPNDRYSAKFSLQHTVAIALAEGKVIQASFDADARERVAEIRDKVAVSLSEPINNAYPKSWGSEVSLTTTSGSTLSEVRSEAKGDPGNPVSAGEVEAKARLQLAEAGLSDRRIDALVDAILDLPNNYPVLDLDLLSDISINEKTRVARSA
ncbi:MmgE/PrpD family protein [Mesorhizobium denitrificans]|uniref:MmgE/PrpD family protein n=1 Tax=Mesorhizobium denitrificans TaxID=2294114 RepID=A0A371XBK6_9HYPH|nr:MmgE/PrpD family protein [Mesorhizobium denitrificans]RFC66592.1 MmgE/PrpD family protein [Mesorhizobium denitrificans]